jgi:dTDP-4-dehydrorhamnose reductase
MLLLGSMGYVGTAFQKLFESQGIPYTAWSRKQIPYTQREVLHQKLQELRPEFVINCAGYTGKPNVDACELHKAECLAGNAVFPGILGEVCSELRIPFGHVSSGCIYTGSKADGSGFTETDPPNFCFRTNNCSFYSGTKALGEECLAGCDQAYVWRLRIPFNHLDSPRNYLSKLLNYERLLEATNSISHLDEFVAACHQTWVRRVPFGIYNVTNTGQVTTRQVVAMIQQHLPVAKEFRFFDSEDDFMAKAAKTPRSNCVMDNSKLLATGITMRSVEDAISDSLKHWTRG